MPKSPSRLITSACLAFAAALALVACAEEPAPTVALAEVDRNALAVVRVEGTPAEWDLEGRVAHWLRAREIPARAGATGGGYVLRGRTTVMKEDGDTMLNWELFDAKGTSLGEVRQLASLSGQGGAGPDRASLDAVALAAAEGVARLVPIAPAEAETAARIAPAAGPVATDVTTRRTQKTTAVADQSPPQQVATKAVIVYWAQLAALRDQEAAAGWYAKVQQVRADLVGDLPHIVSRADLGAGKGVWYRVRLGPFAGRAAAARTCEKFKSAGMNCLIGTSG